MNGQTKKATKKMKMRLKRKKEALHYCNMIFYIMTNNTRLKNYSKLENQLFADAHNQTQKSPNPLPTFPLSRDL